MIDSLRSDSIQRADRPKDFAVVDSAIVGPFKLFGEKSGQIAAHGDVLILDIPLSANTVTLPITLYDANEFTFDIRQNGSPLCGP